MSCPRESIDSEDEKTQDWNSSNLIFWLLDKGREACIAAGISTAWEVLEKYGAMEAKRGECCKERVINWVNSTE